MPRTDAQLYPLHCHGERRLPKLQEQDRGEVLILLGLQIFKLMCKFHLAAEKNSVHRKNALS
jgi:hypothetical protein